MANHNEMYVAGVTTLYVTGNFNAKPGSKITVGIGAALRLYVGTISGSSVSATFDTVNNAGDAFNFQFFGLPTCTSLIMSVPSAYYFGTVYAPEAVLTVNVGSANGLDYQGACAANSIVVNGHFNFHFDQNLKRLGPMR